MSTSSKPRKPGARRRFTSAPTISPARWARMTKAQKAVAIAKDAIWRVEHSQILPACGSFVSFLSYNEPAIRKAGLDPLESNELQKLLSIKGGVTCECCALGGAICGLAHHEDAVLEGRMSYSDTRHRLEAIFGESCLRAIEIAFEGGDGYYYADLDEDQQAVAFGKQYSHPKTRFLAIWKNVVKNRGQFKP